ncbi:serine/threonine protein kinase [Yinghuangia sp. ASG 101]|uniref:serine/threonine-protein kinase n=1 Tax=Yinghuangia sp. ASG 101 TaxID=2896848 RepID=UPI001E468538|nr:serine/threonine-protein kinase [Yinghuangia sp. ASG 101]UGQ10288.1 serine/threonine protein kinase [Yinghuangia sp. ASG 101]
MEALKPGDPGAVGRYRLSARLDGNGRLGTVFLGKSRDGGAVTVRLVRPDLAADKRFVERFRKTIEAVRRIDGPHLAHVLDADPDATPPWLVAEYAPGITLEEAVRAHGPLPEKALRALGAALSRALVAVHAAKVVHQGLAAGTVMLTRTGPQITDLGLTALLGADASAALPAPEQATGGAVTPATDVFALAGVVCQAAGVAPYGDVDAAELAQRVLRTTPELDGVPEELAALLTRCFARRPDSRPTAAELAELFDGDDAAGTAWLPTDVAAAVDAAARVRPPKPAAKPARSQAAARAEDGADETPSEKSAAAGGPRGGGTPGPRKPAAAVPGTPADTGDAVGEDDGNEETVEVGVGVAVAATADEDVTAPVPAAEKPAPAAPTVVVRKPLDEAQLLKPRTPQPAAPQTPAAPAAASTPTEVAAPARPADAPARPVSPAPSTSSAPSAPPRPAEAAPTVVAPRWSPAGPPAEDARGAAPAAPAGPPQPPAPPYGDTPREAPAPAKRQASAGVWYAVIVLVGLTSAGLAVYRLFDSEWRDLQNPVMGLVLPGVSLVFGLAGLVVLALVVGDRRKSSGDPRGT